MPDTGNQSFEGKWSVEAIKASSAHGEALKTENGPAGEEVSGL